MSIRKSLSRPNLDEKFPLSPRALIDALDRYVKAQDGNLQLVEKSIEQAIHAKENGNFYAVHSTQFPIELLWPLGITPLLNELYGTIISLVGNDLQQYPTVADDIGFPRGNRPHYRTFYSMAEAGAWPLPDFVACCSSPCDPAAKRQEMAARCMEVPSFGLDRPYKNFVREHMALVRFLEEQTGRTMDYDYLKEVMQLSFRATQVYREINELRGMVPCPLPAEASFAPMAVYGAWAGTQTCVDFLEQLREELQDRVDRGIGAVPDERFRCTCATSLPLLDFGIMAQAERRYGAVNVIDHLQWWREDPDWLIDPDDPVASLAYRVQFGASGLLYGTAMDYVEQLRQAAVQCRADGVICFNSPGCPRAAADGRVLEDALEHSLDLPWVAIDCDKLATSPTSFDEVMAQLDAFFESVEKSSSYRERSWQRSLRPAAGRATP
jgi:benzoyl-CoA reductase/2-hydroxyglutaryl-CoA dehydratase subunit BcrC/BadD/HgdB